MYIQLKEMNIQNDRELRASYDIDSQKSEEYLNGPSLPEIERLESEPLVHHESTDEITQLSGISPYDQPLIVKILILMCISFLTFGSYFAYDAVSALESPIKKDLDINGWQFGLLYSVYSFPNIFFVLVGGIITDKMGNRFSALLFCSLFAFGSGLVAFAGQIGSWYLMLGGRFIFGIGAESSYVVQNNICIEWFSQSKYFAFAMGITLTISRLGSILAFTTVTNVADAMGNYHWGLWFGFLCTLVSLLSSFVFSVVDKYTKNRVGFKDKHETNALFLDPRLLSRFYYLWLIIAVTIYSTIFPFLAMAGEYIAKKWNMPDSEANEWLGFIDLTSLIMSPVFGFVVDHTGKRGFLVIAGTFLAVVSYLMLGLTRAYPLVPIMILGTHFALMPAALWPCLPSIVTDAHSGFAFSLVSSLMNASLTGISPLSGFVVDNYGFTWFCMLFACISAISFLTSLLWNLLDLKRKPPVLNTKPTTNGLTSIQSTPQ